MHKADRRHCLPILLGGVHDVSESVPGLLDELPYLLHLYFFLHKLQAIDGADVQQVPTFVPGRRVLLGPL